MIDIQTVESIHNILIDKFGGGKGIRDIGALEASLARPYATFDQSGQLKSETTFTENTQNGVFKYYSEKGILTLETLYVNGKKTGVNKQYYPSGKLHTETPYTGGEIKGEIKTYDENGILISPP